MKPYTMFTMLSIGVLALVPLQLSYGSSQWIVSTCTVWNIDLVNNTQGNNIVVTAYSPPVSGIYNTRTILTDTTGTVILWGPLDHITADTPKGVYVAESGTTSITTVFLKVEIWDMHGGLQLVDFVPCL